MGIFSLFKPAEPANPAVLLWSWSLAYDALPKILFASPAAIISALQQDGRTALQTYVAAFVEDCAKVHIARTDEKGSTTVSRPTFHHWLEQELPQNINPDQAIKSMVDHEAVYGRTFAAARPHIPRDFTSMFSVQVTQIHGNQTVLLITHPRPPHDVVDLQPGTPLLAPFFTAILWSQSSVASPSYYVLQQALPASVALRHGTMLRSVYADGSSGNTMKSCKPNPEALLTFLRSPPPVICLSKDNQTAATAPARADSATTTSLARGGEVCTPSLASSSRSANFT